MADVLGSKRPLTQICPNHCNTISVFHDSKTDSKTDVPKFERSNVTDLVEPCCNSTQNLNIHLKLVLASSVNRLGNLLDIRQLFKAFGNNYFSQISHILRPI